MQSNVRVVGSNYTVFRWRGRNIAYLDSIQDSGVRPIAPIEPITPLGESHPTEFVTARATTEGTLTLTIRELWDKDVWQHLFGLAAANDIVDVWRVMAADPSSTTCQTIIKPPTGNYYRTKTYHNVVVSQINDGETITLGAMSVPKQITCVYTHATRDIVTATG